MKFRIIAIKRDEAAISESEATKNGFDFIYVDVEFIEAGRVVHRNDFRMQIAKQHRRYVGAVGAEGEILEPGNYEAYANDVADEIRANIERYMRRLDLQKMPFDYRDPSIKTSNNDPLNLRDRTVMDLIGVELDDRTAVAK